MKLLILIFMFAFFVPVHAETSKKELKDKKADAEQINSVEIQQSQIDSINISQMVQEQIDAARKKVSEQKSVPMLKVETKKSAATKKAEAGFWTELKSLIPVSSDASIKALIIFAFSLFVFGIILFRRFTSKKIKPESMNEVNGLKKNIALIREEKPVKVKDKNKLRQIRSKLIQNYSSSKMTNESVSRTAKELKIAQGELLLAERINLHKMAGEYAGKKSPAFK